MRNNTTELGDRAEAFAETLLVSRGFHVVNLNKPKRNHQLFDLAASKDGRSVRVSVKSDRRLRQVSLGPPSTLAQLPDDVVVMAFLPIRKGVEIRFESGDFELLIIPGAVARNEGLAVHKHYVATHPGSADHRVMVKDKIDRNPGTISGAAFKSWYDRFLNAWHVIEG